MGQASVSEASAALLHDFMAAGEQGGRPSAAPGVSGDVSAGERGLAGAPRGRSPWEAGGPGRGGAAAASMAAESTFVPH